MLYVLALWFHVACLLLNIVVEQYEIKGDYVFEDYAKWSVRDDQI